MASKVLVGAHPRSRRLRRYHPLRTTGAGSSVHSYAGRALLRIRYSLESNHIYRLDLENDRWQPYSFSLRCRRQPVFSTM